MACGSHAHDVPMRKELLPATVLTGEAAAGDVEQWLTLGDVALVQVSSEDSQHTIESALGEGVDEEGWRAAAPGRQVIQFRFDKPQRLRRIKLEIDELLVERTQELTIAWSAPATGMREAIRQQWNFSPAGCTREVEDYRVELDDVVVLQISVTPHVGNDEIGVATIKRLRVG